MIVNAGGELHLVAPFLVTAAVGEKDDAAPLKAFHAFWRKPTTSTGGQPQVFGLMGCHDECGLLALDNTDTGFGVSAEQVLTEEALIELPVTGQESFADEPRVHPTLHAPTVTVGTVLHDMSPMHLLLLVHLPKDDLSPTGGSDEVVVKDLLNLLGRNMEPGCRLGGEPLPEGALG